jgi:hypothetical protein
VRFGVSQKDPPQFGQLRPPAFDFEEPYTELILQASDCVADGRLRTVELLCGWREAAELDDRLQNLPFIKGGSHTRSIYRRNRSNCVKIASFASRIFESNMRVAENLFRILCPIGWALRQCG